VRLSTTAAVAATAVAATAAVAAAAAAAVAAAAARITERWRLRFAGLEGLVGPWCLGIDEWVIACAWATERRRGKRTRGCLQMSVNTSQVYGDALYRGVRRC
jgi:hypothetical protein